jgi:YidC/Oxa1 family membrane protein insertase
MDRKTLLAVVISVVVIVGGMLLQSVLFPPSKKPPAPAPQQPAAQQQEQTSEQKPAQPAEVKQQAEAKQQAPATTVPVRPAGGTGRVEIIADAAIPETAQMIQRETDLYALVFSTAGGTLTSVRLKKYKNVDGSPVEMVLLPSSETETEVPFGISFGDYKTRQVKTVFALRESTDGTRSTFEFSRAFLSPTGVPFTLRKTFLFYKDEYLFELRVSIENSVNDLPVLDFGGYSYTMSLGPQIGPHFANIDGKNDFRNYAYWADGKRQDPKVGSGALKELDRRVTWTGIVGKYFTAIAVPDATEYRIVFDSRKLVDRFERSALWFERPLVKSAKSVDTFRFYLGPMKKEILGRYNSVEKNRFGISNLRADEVVTSSVLLGWLAQLLKWVLEFFFMIIPNYGVAIILLTLLTKVVFLPLTFKSSESTAKMAALNPKMAEIRARLKDKPDKMNQEIAALYKREKVNPLSGCLPLLLQIPIFFALYNLLNSYFELRGALFIPGWIPDLSVPESLLSFPFTVPLVGWTALRGLPLLMVASQLLQGKITQPPDTAQSGAQMKLMTYVLPIVFLFILYDMPSGLVLYWTVQNVLSIFQQLYINRLNARKKAMQGPPVIEKAGMRAGGKNRK